MKRVLWSLFAVVLLSGITLAIHAEDAAEPKSCFTGAMQDMTPHLTAELAQLPARQVAAPRTYLASDGSKISSAPIEARDEDGKLLFAGTLSCTSICGGTGTCSGSGCEPSGTTCSGFSCHGFICTGSCRKVITVANK